MKDRLKVDSRKNRFVPQYDIDTSRYAYHFGTTHLSLVQEKEHHQGLANKQSDSKQRVEAIYTSRLEDSYHSYLRARCGAIRHYPAWMQLRNYDLHSWRRAALDGARQSHSSVFNHARRRQHHILFSPAQC